MTGSLIDTPPTTWHTGVDTVTVPATDEVGIKQTTLYVDGDAITTGTRPCDYTYVVPCTNEPGANLSISWPAVGFADGAHTVQVGATDAAGNETRSPLVSILVDAHAPTAPLSLAATTTTPVAAGTPVAYTLSWTDPAQGSGSPIASANYSVCPAGSTTGCGTGQAVGAGVQSATVTIPAPGQWTASVWLTDAAGNVNPASAAAVTFERAAPPPPPPPPPPPTPSLRITGARLAKRTLTVAGKLEHAATVRVTYTVHVRRKARTLSASGRQSHGTFRVRFRIPKGAAVSRKARVVAIVAATKAHPRIRVTHRVAFDHG